MGDVCLGLPVESIDVIARKVYPMSKNAGWRRRWCGAMMDTVVRIRSFVSDFAKRLDEDIRQIKESINTETTGD